MPILRLPLRSLSSRFSSRLPTRSLHLRKSSTSSSTASPSRLSRLISRLPPRLQPLLHPLREAPVSHITAFLLLHELTALVPLFGLAAVFHYTDWLPAYFSEGEWVGQGVEKFGRWMRRKGWIDDDDDKDGGGENQGRGQGQGDAEGTKEEKARNGKLGVKVVVELATAYAITKALLPVRVGLSVWGTPWFARWTVLPITRRFAGRGKTGSLGTDGRGVRSAAAGTGATGGGVGPRDWR